MRKGLRIGPRHAKRLRAFSDPLKLVSWFQMPAKLSGKIRRAVETAKRKEKKVSLETVNDMIVEIIHRVTRCCPLRRENVAEIKRPDVEGTNLLLPGVDGAKGYIHIDGEYVKNGVEQDIELTPEAVAAIRYYLEHGRPRLAEAVGATAENPWLFPAYGMNAKDAGDLNDAFVARNRSKKLGGFLLNMHVQRHLCAKLILDMDPTAMPLVQILLGHTSIETTRAYYAEVNRLLAQRRFQEILANAERNAVAAIAAIAAAKGNRSDGTL